MRIVYFIIAGFISFLAESASFGQSKEVKTKQEKSAQVKIKQKKEIERSQEKLKSEHYHRQTKKVQDRMKSSRKRSQKFNKQNDKTFFDKRKEKRRLKKNR